MLIITRCLPYRLLNAERAAHKRIATMKTRIIINITRHRLALLESHWATIITFVLISHGVYWIITLKDLRLFWIRSGNLLILLSQKLGCFCLQLKVLFEPFAEELSKDKVLWYPDRFGFEDVLVEMGFKSLWPSHFGIGSNLLTYLG